MKLHCIVEVKHRSLRLLDVVTKKKAQQACLTVKSVDTNDMYILLQTQQNKQGIKYKVDNNIEKIFGRRLDDNKLTLRMVEPPHDLVVQSDAAKLKSFINVLKRGVFQNPSILTIPNLKSTTLSAKRKKRKVRLASSEYPVLQGFPETTEELYVKELTDSSFDPQILQLQSLTVLNLSGNQISMLPKELGTLPHLQKLFLSQNHLGEGPVTKWTWLDQAAVKQNLCLLDISSNLLRAIPEQIGKLKALVTLKANVNMLTHLPQSLGNVSTLKYLELSGNHLYCLPGSIITLQFFLIDISKNPFPSYVYRDQTICLLGMPSLVQYAARVLLKRRIPYDQRLLPPKLIEFLDRPNYCFCGNACFNTYVKTVMKYNLCKISKNTKYSGENIFAPFECYFCSVNCLFRFSRT